MKKYIILATLIGFYTSASFSFYQANKSLEEKNQKLYQDFKKEKLVDVTGKVNLIEVKTKKQNLETEMKELFQQNKIDKETYSKQLEEIQSKNTILKNQEEELSVQVTTLEGKKNELTEQYDVLKNKYTQLQKAKQASQANTNNSYGFPLINQYPTYPTGCESVALTMLLRYYGINVSPDAVISRLKKESLPYDENGVRYGGNPEVAFIGNPYSNASYGVYEKPIAEVANIYKSGIQIRNNFSFSEVLNLVQNNHPVMVWTSMGLSVPYISESWTYKPTMETIYWKAGEHAVVIVSYYRDTVIVADPIGGKLKSYSASLFEQRYNYFGRKALYY